MGDGNDNQCPICWDNFKFPKLLPCRHTYCCQCLTKYIKRSTDRSEINCPLCRQSWWIPPEGIKDFLNNYFVEDASSTEEKDDDLSPCDMCRHKSQLKECAHCRKRMCHLCVMSHKEALKFTGVDSNVFDLKSEMSDSDSESNDSDDPQSQGGGRRHNRSEQFHIPFHLLLSLPPIRTKYKVTLVSEINFGDIHSRSHNYNFINCITPVSDTECLVIPFAGPDIMHCHFAGERKRAAPLGSGTLTGVLSRPDKSLLVSLWGERTIVIIQNDLLCGFYETGIYRPHSLAMFPDGKVVFVGPHEKSGDSNDEDEKFKIMEGTCQILSRDGMLIKEINHHRAEKPLFVNPASVAVSPSGATFAVADRGKSCVYVFLQDGNLIAKYTGGSRHRMFMLLEHHEHQRHFIPLSLCYDREGHVIIIDAVNKILHVLNEAGEFIGVIGTEDGDLGNPFSVAVDFGGRLWIGEEFNKTVKIYEVESYLNCFQREN